MRRATLALREPVGAADRVHAARVSLFLRLDDDGAVGWGECPVAATRGVDPDEREVLAALPAALTGTRGDGPGSRAATALVAAARTDLALRREGRSFADALGVGAPDVAFAGVVGVDAPAASARRARALVELGATRLRVKVAPPPSGLDALRAVLDAVDVPVAADANGCLDPADEALLAELCALPLAWLEQPFAPGAEATARLARAGVVRVGLDESLTSLEALEVAAAAGVTVACLKPSRLGGPRVTEALHRAADLGLEAYVGGYFEAGLGRALLGALSALAPLDGDVVAPSAYLVDDPCALPGPLGGRQPLHRGPGVGPPPGASLDVVTELSAPSAGGAPT